MNVLHRPCATVSINIWRVRRVCTCVFLAVNKSHRCHYHYSPLSVLASSVFFVLYLKHDDQKAIISRTCEHIQFISVQYYVATSHPSTLVALMRAYVFEKYPAAKNRTHKIAHAQNANVWSLLRMLLWFSLIVTESTHTHSRTHSPNTLQYKRIHSTRELEPTNKKNTEFACPPPQPAITIVSETREEKKRRCVPARARALVLCNLVATKTV